MKKWVCDKCGYASDTPDAPEKCPECGSTKFDYLSDEEVRQLKELAEALKDLKIKF